MTVTALTPPENGITKAFRRIQPFIAALDYIIVAVIATRFGLVLFMPQTETIVEGQAIGFFEVFPFIAVVITACLATGLITSRLSGLETDKGDLAGIRDAQAKTERSTHLSEQIDICRRQRSQSYALIVVYIALSSIPHVLNLEVTSIWGKLLLSLITIGEITVPLLNVRTFSIVESTMHKIDVVGNVIYASNRAAMGVLSGITDRAATGAATRSELRALRKGRSGDIDGMLTTREQKPPEAIQGAVYISLRQRVTGVPDGHALETWQQRRYDKAQEIARKYRVDGSEWLPHFKRGKHNVLLVDGEVGDMILSELAERRIRPARTKQPVTSE